jgi:hypothetical protein
MPAIQILCNFFGTQNSTTCVELPKANYSEHSKTGRSGFWMVIFRSGFRMVRFSDARFYKICSVFEWSKAKQRPFCFYHLKTVQIYPVFEWS